MGIDLHMHSTASDGLAAPVEVVRMAAEAGLTRIALTDHDTLDGLAAAEAAGEGYGVRVVPGIELSAVMEGTGVHILGYLFDPQDAALASFLRGWRGRRLERMERMLARLGELGVAIDMQEVLREAGRAQVGRPHLARVLVKRGHVKSFHLAFQKWLAKDAPAYLPAGNLAVAEVIRAIHGAGGVCSFAHPAMEGLDHAIPAMAAAGLDALEAYHADHDAQQVRRYEALAAEHGLLTTGGSDFHGRPGSHRRHLGSVSLDEELYEALVARAKRRCTT